jgi:Domain of unknown function (DUF4870)
LRDAPVRRTRATAWLVPGSRRLGQPSLLGRHALDRRAVVGDPARRPDERRDDSRTWALAAHLPAPVSMIVAMAFIGPLVVYLVKKDDPFVRRHAAEALNFNLSS